MARTAEPEREIVRRLAPLGGPTALLALGIGTLVGGWRVGWSAAIGIAVVSLNLVAQGLSVAWAAPRSANLLAATVMGGFAVRLGTIGAVLFWLTHYGWFSALVFAVTVVPATAVLLAYEMRLVARGLGGTLVLTPDEGSAFR